MPVRFYKKPVIVAGSVAFLAVLIIALFFLLYKNHTPQKEQYKAEKKQLSEIFATLDTSYWKNKTKSLSLSNEAIRISRKINDSNALSEALFHKAGALQDSKRDDSSLIIFNNTLTIAKKSQNDTLIAKIKNSIGNYYYFKDNYYLAMRYFAEALKIAESLGNEITTGMYSNGLGLVNLSLGDYNKAIAYFQQTVNACKKSGNLRDMSGTLMNIGNCYIEKKDFRKALFYNKSALVAANRIHDNELIGKIYISLGMIKLIDKENLENEPEALDYFYKALECSKQVNNRKISGLAFQNIGSYYMDSNQLDKAEDFFNKSLSIFSETGSKSYETRANLALSDIKKKQGQWQKAYLYHIRYVELKDSIQNTDIQKKISDYQYEIEIQKKQYEKELLRKKYEVQKRSNIFLAGSIFFVIILALVIRKSLKKSIKLQKLENAHLQEKIQMADKIKELEANKHQMEIEAKNKELVSFSLQLTTKNDLLNEISKLSEKHYNSKTIDKEYYNELTKVIENNLNVDKEWSQFKDLFEKVHHGFFNRLKQNCPGLTEHELRFCAYVKINLRPKEIARILNIGSNSVKTFRNRLKKKLALDIDASLDDFLRNI